MAALLAKAKNVAEALRTYETARLPPTARIVQNNRSGGPERVIDIVERRAPDGFTDLDKIASHTELEAMVKGYAKMAGFDKTHVNH